MSNLSELIANLDSTEISQLINSPTLRGIFAEEVSNELDCPEEEVILHLEKLHAKEQEDIDKTLHIRRRLSSLGGGDTYHERRNKAALMDQMIEVMKTQNRGLSKTELLKLLKKDNGSWRVRAEQVLEYMLSRGLIMKVGSKYYHASNFMERENSFHRKVYEIICDFGPVSRSYILNRLKYRNPSGMSKLHTTLSMMEEEGFVVSLDGQKWGINTA